jgi:DNA gyrase/topoisomerase IV subunit A
LEENASVTLNLLSLDPERKVECYNKYFINEHVFHIEKYDKGRKTYNSGVCVKRSTSNEFEVDYYKKLEEVIELQYHNEQNKIFLLK